SFLEAGPQGTSLTVALPGSDNTKDYRQTLVGLYGQDEYKIRSNLQLSLGLRYEFTTLIHERFGRDSFLVDPVRDTQVQVGPLLKNNPSVRNFSPRIGLAWSPEGSRNTVVRADFGIYYDEILAYVFDLLKSGLPFFRTDAGPVNPAFQGGITLMSSDAQSFYNSLLVSADSRLNRALSFRTSYTYSKSVDDASSLGFGNGSQQYGLRRTLERGLSDFD